MFNLGPIRFKFKCCCSLPATVEDSVPIEMAPRNKKPSKSTSTTPSTSPWQTMVEAFTCKRVSSASSPLKPCNNGTQPTTLANNQHAYFEDVRTSMENLVDLNYQRSNAELLQTVTELKHQLEYLKGVLEEREFIDAEKDKLIERLSNTVQMLQTPPSSIIANGKIHSRQRSISGESHHLQFNLQKSELRFSSTAPKVRDSGYEPHRGSTMIDYYDDGDLV